MTIIDTYSGRKFNYETPTVEMICIEDVAHSLARHCRYNGHVAHFYSVAEHCVILSHYVPEELALPALLHDAVEAYIGDIPAPFKDMHPALHDYETKVMTLVIDAFDLGHVSSEDWKKVMYADKQICMDEMEHLMKGAPRWAMEPLGVPRRKFVCYMPPLAKEQFLLRYEELTGKETSRGVPSFEPEPEPETA